VALAAIKGEKTLAVLALQFDVLRTNHELEAQRLEVAAGCSTACAARPR